MRRRLLLIGVAVALVVAAAVVVVVRLLDGGPDSRVAEAVALAPEGSQRLNWTDWAGVREEVGSDVSASSTPAELSAFLDEGYDVDLTSASAIGSSRMGSSALTLHTQYGVSPASLEWELFAQGEDGAIVLLGLPEDFDLSGLEGTLEDLGYQPPADEGGVWSGGADVLARIGTVTPELAYLRIDEEHRLLLGSDSDTFLAGWGEGLREEGGDGVADVVTELGGALSANIYTGDHACGALAMSQAAGADRTRGSQLLEKAGEVDPMTGFAIAELPGGEVRVVMGFETEDQARTNAETRAALAAGPAPGQGGDFADRFELASVIADGKVVTMELRPVGEAFVVSDLADGPVLFATC